MTNKITPEQIRKEMENANALNVKDVAPEELKRNTLSDVQIYEIANQLSSNFGIHVAYAYTAIYLLFLKGAANSGTPETTTVNIFDQDKQQLSITKFDLIYAYNLITGNKYIRRLAEALAIPIGNYAEKNGLSGDIADKISNGLMSNANELLRYPLTIKERAWASSFSQKIPGLEKLSSERMPQLLAIDYNERFAKSKRKVNPPTRKETTKTVNRKTLFPTIKGRTSPQEQVQKTEKPIPSKRGRKEENNPSSFKRWN
jgi:hypothetical protein